MSEPVYLTRAGYEKLMEEMKTIKKNRLKIADQIEEARLQGDLSENAEYDAAKEAQAHNATHLLNVEAKLANVRIIEDQDIPGDKIYIGAIVKLLDLDTDEKMEYQLVSPEESNYDENKISITSPIGKSLLGHPKGAELKIKVPAGTLNYKVISIKRPK